MKVSVVMPMKDAAAYVRAAMSSVLEEKDQELELIVVDDGSTDSSRLIVEGFGDPRVRLIAGPCRGFAASFNAGLFEARGEIIMEADADDLYTSGRISRQVAWLQSHPEAEAVCGRFSTISATGKLVANLVDGPDQQIEQTISDELRAGGVRTHFCTYAIRRSALSKVGTFREYFETAPDTDLQLRLGETVRVDFLPENFYRYRLHDNSITHTQPNLRRLFFEQTAYEFQRQRRVRGSDDLTLGTPPAPPPRDASKGFDSARQIQGMLTGRAWQEADRGDYRRAFFTGFDAFRYRPSSVQSWIELSKLSIILLMRLVRGRS